MYEACSQSAHYYECKMVLEMFIQLCSVMFWQCKTIPVLVARTCMHVSYHHFLFNHAITFCFACCNKWNNEEQDHKNQRNFPARLWKASWRVDRHRNHLGKLSFLFQFWKVLWCMPRWLGGPIAKGWWNRCLICYQYKMCPCHSKTKGLMCLAIRWHVEKQKINGGEFARNMKVFIYVWSIRGCRPKLVILYVSYFY